MSFFYCRDDGTATGDGGRYTSEKANNAWDTEFTATSEYYDSLESALEADNPPVNGDVIYISSASNFIKGSSVTLTISPVPTNPVQVYSVDDSAINEYLAGALDGATDANGDYSITSVGLDLSLHGVSVSTGDDFSMGFNNSSFISEDATLTLAGSTDKIFLFQDGVSFQLTNTDIILPDGSTTPVVEMRAAALFSMCGGSISVTSGTLNDFIGASGIAGGMTCVVEATDLSDFGSGSFLLGTTGGDQTNDDLIDMRIRGCILNANVGYVEEEFAGPNKKFLMTNSSASSDAAEYQFYQRTWAGDVEDQDDSGIHRDESIPYPSGAKVSWEITTNADCSKGRPLIVDLPFRFSELSNASTDTIRVYFAQPNTQPALTNTNCWAEVYYPDGTTKNLWINGSNRASDILSAGTEHTDDSGSSTWLDGVSALTGHDEYRMDIALDGTDGAAGSDGIPRVRIFITEPSATIFFDTTRDTVA